MNPRRNLSVKQFPVADLLPHASDRTSDPRMRRNVEQIAESFRRFGPNSPARGGRFLLREYGNHVGSMEHAPVTLWHTDEGSFVEPGNHRVHAAALAGLEHLPVEVRDRRTR